MTKTIVRLSSMLIACAILAPASAVTYIVPKYIGPRGKIQPKTTMLNRLELRDCMKLEASNKTRMAELDVKAAQSEKERLALVAAAGADKQAEEEWKKRYDALLKEDDALNESREEYFMDCARRPHKQEDEDAINAEK